MSLFGSFADWFRAYKKNSVLGPFLTFVNPLALTGGQIGDLTAQQAMTISSVYASVATYADTISTLGLYLYEGDGETIVGKARQHPLYDLLSVAPNQEQTSQQWLEYAIRSLFMKGNSYSQIVRTNGGRIKEIVPLDPDLVTPRREQGDIVYHVKPHEDAPSETLFAQDVLHFHVNYNAKVLRGVSPIAYAKQSISIGLSLDQFALSFFSQGANSKVVLEVPGNIDQKQADQIKQKWEENNSGLENASRTGITSGGIKVHTLTIAPDECQFLESRKFTVNEIARWYKLPAYKIGGEGSKGTYSNREMDSMEFVTHSIRPVCVNFEQEATKKLLLPSERAKFFIKFDFDELLRTNLEARYRAYSIGRNGGWLSTNDIRRKENLIPVDGGDTYLQSIKQIALTETEDVKKVGEDGN